MSKCPYCRADDENVLVVIDNRRPFEEDERECARCGCLWNERHPTEIAGFQYDDPREQV